MPLKPPAEIAAVYASYPAPVRRQLLALRALIFATAKTEQVGAITECLKWGEPAYVTASGSGTTIRLAWSAKRPRQYGLYVNCQTDLIETFRGQFGDGLTYAGNRGITVDLETTPPHDKLAICIAAALSYHRRRKKALA